MWRMSAANTAIAWLAFIAPLLTPVPVNAADKNAKICNWTKIDYYISIGYTNTTNPVSTGWYPVPPGKCFNIAFPHADAASAIFAFAQGADGIGIVPNSLNKLEFCIEKSAFTDKSTAWCRATEGSSGMKLFSYQMFGPMNPDGFSTSNYKWDIN